MLEKFENEQPIVYKILKNTVKKENFSHAYLFETNGYSKGFDLALSFSKEILCPTHGEHLNPCSVCTMIDTLNFPELMIIRPDGLWIKKEQLLELQNEFSKKAIIGTKKIYIIDHVDRLNVAAANSILKFLEEPEPNIIAILIADNIYQLLTTIISRCQIISFSERNLLFEQSATEIQKMASIIATGENEYQELIQQDPFQAKVQAAIHFVQYFEENGITTIIYTQRLWHDIFTERNDFGLGFQVMALYYKDILNGYYHRPHDIFECDDKMLKIIDKNTPQMISKKIKIVLELKQAVSVNANSNLLMDKLIIEWKGGD